MSEKIAAHRASTLLAEVRAAARQEQFLEVVSAEEARARFERHLTLAPLAAQTVSLGEALGRVLAQDVAAPQDAPPFDRANVDGFAVRAADTLGARDAQPRRFRLNPEVLVCGRAPEFVVKAGTATAIATGGVIPRGADAVVMIEHTEFSDAVEGPVVDVSRAVAPGQFVSYAGSDIARGETLLRRGAQIGSREIGMLAACGIDSVDVVRRPKVAILSTGDELVPPGAPLGSAAVYDSNGAVLAAAVTEIGGEPVMFGAFPDDKAKLEASIRDAIARCDLVVLSGGTSKGAGDLCHHVVSRLGPPGIIVHGVALKPGKPLCLAVVGQTAIVVLPGFPTSAVFTFHSFVAPVIRQLAGLRAKAAQKTEAYVPMRIGSELGRKEFVMVSLVAGDAGPIAFPSGKGSGAITTFAQADGFFEIEALATTVDPGTRVQVTMLGRGEAPDLVLAGSHCLGLDIVLGALSQQGFTGRTLAIGSLGGLAAARRGECDLAPVHLINPTTGIYNRHVAGPGLTLVRGWERMQGIVFREGDLRFEGRTARDAISAALADPACLMVNRNAGSGTRVLIDQLLDGARPAGYGNQPRSHNAVAAAVAQKRADWGVAIQSVARLYGVGFLPLTPECYDFLLLESRRHRPAVQAFLSALSDEEVRERIRSLGMLPAEA
jgi:putative molybdopterin biosynthesis protein